LELWQIRHRTPSGERNAKKGGFLRKVVSKSYKNDAVFEKTSSKNFQKINIKNLLTRFKRSAIM
jgi:hypothetical protein